jgi:hypothetical protein
METPLLALRGLRNLAPTHFHFDVCSLQHEIIRRRLRKCTEDFPALSKKRKRPQREAQPKPNAVWPNKKGKAAVKLTTRKIVSITASVSSLAPALRAVSLETSANAGTMAIPNIDQQLAEAQRMIQRLHEQKASALTHLSEVTTAFALPPKSPESEQGSQPCGRDRTKVEDFSALPGVPYYYTVSSRRKKKYKAFA